MIESRDKHEGRQQREYLDRCSAGLLLWKVEMHVLAWSKKEERKDFHLWLEPLWMTWCSMNRYKSFVQKNIQIRQAYVRQPQSLKVHHDRFSAIIEVNIWKTLYLWAPHEKLSWWFRSGGYPVSKGTWAKWVRRKCVMGLANYPQHTRTVVDLTL